MHKTAFYFLNLNDINKMLLLTLISQRKKFSSDAKKSLFGGIQGIHFLKDTNHRSLESEKERANTCAQSMMD